MDHAQRVLGSGVGMSGALTKQVEAPRLQQQLQTIDRLVLEAQALLGECHCAMDRLISLPHPVPTGAESQANRTTPTVETRLAQHTGDLEALLAGLGILRDRLNAAV